MVSDLLLGQDLGVDPETVVHLLDLWLEVLLLLSELLIAFDFILL
jgi:hypothetical protein